MLEAQVQPLGGEGPKWPAAVNGRFSIGAIVPLPLFFGKMVRSAMRGWGVKQRVSDLWARYSFGGRPSM